MSEREPKQPVPEEESKPSSAEAMEDELESEKSPEEAEKEAMEKVRDITKHGTCISGLKDTWHCGASTMPDLLLQVLREGLLSNHIKERIGRFELTKEEKKQEEESMEKLKKEDPELWKEMINEEEYVPKNYVYATTHKRRFLHPDDNAKTFAKTKKIFFVL